MAQALAELSSLQPGDDRLDPAAMQLLRDAAALSDLGEQRPGLQMRLLRAVNAGRLSPEHTALFEQCKRDRTGHEQLVFLRAWAEGRIPMQDLRVELRQSAARVVSKENADTWGWANWHELMVLMNGYADPRAEANVQHVWDACARQQRPHPVKGLERQRWCYLRTEDTSRNVRTTTTKLEAAGDVEPMAE